MPTDIYNFDESGFHISISKNQQIITRKPYWKTYFSTDTNHELVTMIKIISSNGVNLLPIIIFMGIQFLYQQFKNLALFNYYLLALLEIGYLNNKLAFNQLKYLNIYSSQHQLGIYRLLIFNSYSSHFIKEFIKYYNN